MAEFPLCSHSAEEDKEALWGLFYEATDLIRATLLSCASSPHTSPKATALGLRISTHIFGSTQALSPWHQRIAPVFQELLVPSLRSCHPRWSEVSVPAIEPEAELTRATHSPSPAFVCWFACLF